MNEEKDKSAEEDVSLMLAAKAGELDAFSFIVKNGPGCFHWFNRTADDFIAGICFPELTQEFIV